MNRGIFCKPISSTKVYNSILIDEYHKCIFGEKETEETSNINLASPSSKMKMTSAWLVGMNVQAPYHFLDGEVDYCEAKIVKIFDDKFAVIEFLGYDDEEVVKLNELRSSEGEEAIEEQILMAQEENEEEEDGDDNEDDAEKIDWIPGMPCRAYYEPMDLIYEATIEKVDSANLSATVLMTGYNITYTVDFRDLFKSDPSLREKQIRSASQHKAETERLSVANSRIDPNRETFEFRANQSTTAPNTHSQHNSQKLVQPKDESEALACLVSAKYLCGYYAGYYDCLKKVAKKDQPDDRPKL